MHTYNKIFNLIQNGSPELRNILSQTKSTRAITQALKQSLPSQIVDHISVGGLKGKTLTLFIDSPVWANRLRYQLSTVLTQLQAKPSLPNITHLELKITPAAPVRQASESIIESKKAFSSTSGAKALREAAATMPDKSLSQSLLRLASRIAKD